MTKTQTAGQSLTATLRRYFHIGTRTRRYRNGADLHGEMLEMIETARQYPGYYSEAQHMALRPAYAVVDSYRKHVDGYRIDGELRMRIMNMTPYQFAALLGDMVDAGITNNGQGEYYFERMARGRSRANGVPEEKVTPR